MEEVRELRAVVNCSGFWNWCGVGERLSFLHKFDLNTGQLMSLKLKVVRVVTFCWGI